MRLGAPIDAIVAPPGWGQANAGRISSSTGSTIADHFEIGMRRPFEGVSVDWDLAF
ncbi:hypothetical protein BH10PSE3_BH10PSE3_10000 [soil metagenome]